MLPEYIQWAQNVAYIDIKSVRVQLTYPFNLIHVSIFLIEWIYRAYRKNKKQKLFDFY